MDTQKAPIEIDYSKCTPCSGLVCMGICPQGILEVGINGKPVVADASSCSRCGVCIDLCPSKAITVAKNKLVSR